MRVNIGPYPDDYTEERLIDINIDDFDTWNMDDTLAHIILPMLKQLKQTKHGSPHVDNEDVPHLPKYQPSSNESRQYDLFQSDEQDELFWQQVHNRWDYVLDEMIFAFDAITGDNWEDEYWSGESDFYFEPIEGTDMSEMKKGPNHTLTLDKKGYTEHLNRIQNGLRLFGKYYRGLWD